MTRQLRTKKSGTKRCRVGRDLSHLSEGRSDEQGRGAWWMTGHYPAEAI